MRIDDVIQFTFDNDEFVNSSKHVIHKGCTDDINMKIKVLNDVVSRFDGGELPQAEDFHHALLKFRLGMQKGNPGQFIDSPKLFRRLAYSFDLSYRKSKKEIDDPVIYSVEETSTALSLLSSNWRDSYLLGLFSVLLSTWENNNQKPIDHLRKFVIEKLKNYDGGRKILCSAKRHSSYFEIAEGNLDLGTWLSFQKMSLHEVTTFLGFPKPWFSKSYFSKVIDAYFEKIKNNTSKYEDFLSLLELHNNTISYKRVLSKMIIQLEHDPNSDIAILVKKYAFEKIGDSIINANWAAPETFTNKEKDNLFNAQMILNRWVTSQFISIFFKVCINSYQRKRFWVEKAKYVDRVKIIGPRDIFRKLKSDDRVSAFVESRYSIAPSIRDISAIMMNIGNFCIIEFSKDGYATQIFEKNNPKCPQIDGKEFDSAQDLVNGLLPRIPTRRGYLTDYVTKEGRLFHVDEWERIYDQFLNRHVLKM